MILNISGRMTKNKNINILNMPSRFDQRQNVLKREIKRLKKVLSKSDKTPVVERPVTNTGTATHIEEERKSNL